MSNVRIRPEMAHRYGQELSIAEQMANQGFDPKTKKLNEAIYGPTNVKFDPVAEMQALQRANVTDSSFLEASMQNWQEQGVPVPEVLPPRTEVTETSPAPVAESSNEDESIDMMPTDPIEKMKWVSEKLKEVNPSAPSANELLQWKQMHGNVFVLQISEDVYIYRYIKRQEWAQMMANPAVSKMRPEQIEDMIVEKCMLFPRLSPERKAFLPAGAIGMLAEQIRIQSQFLDPVQVANVTVKL